MATPSPFSFPLQSGPPRPYKPWTKEEKERLRQAVADMIAQEQAGDPPSPPRGEDHTTDTAQAGT